VESGGGVIKDMKVKKGCGREKRRTGKTKGNRGSECDRSTLYVHIKCYYEIH
jgi:hypothetical protein